MRWRELCSTCDQVTGNFASKVVLQRAFICPFECLEQPFAKSVEDWLMSTCYVKTFNVCAKQDAVSINCHLPYTLLKFNCFIPFRLTLIVVCNARAADGIPYHIEWFQKSIHVERIFLIATWRGYVHITMMAVT